MITLDKYIDPWLFERSNDYIGFYTREYFCLDNFSAFKVTFEGHTYSSVEEAYQALGFVDTAPEIAKEITSSSSPYDAMRISHENLDKRRSDWDMIKVDLMEKLLRAKLSQHHYVKQKLLTTKNYLLLEDSPTDSFWGCGLMHDGENMIGKLWMKIRDEILQTSGDLNE